MKIRDRLSLQFTFLFAAILLLVLVSIYIFTEHNRQLDFNDRLRDRALTTAEIFLAEDNLSEEKFKEVQKKYPISLPGEAVSIYDDSDNPVFIKQNAEMWGRNEIDAVRQRHNVTYRKGRMQQLGLLYNDNSGNFVVLVSATDEYGYKRMNDLLRDMSITFVASIFIVFFLGTLFARNALAPISKVINDVKYIRSTSLDKRLQTARSRDEINELAVTFNNLLEHLEQAFKAQSSFIAHASHELRTPVTAIIGNLEVTLIQERDKQEYEQTLQSVLTEAGKLNDLINNLFEFAQANIDFNTFEDVRLDELVWQVKDEWNNKIKDSQIELIYDITNESNKYIIQGNRELLFIALGNILNNAIKFSNNHKVICSLSQQGRNIEIRIRDKGIGIPEKDMATIFDPFQRASNSIGFPGVGIGLSLTEKIIRLHGARISINTAYKDGTEFVIVFGS